MLRTYLTSVTQSLAYARKHHKVPVAVQIVFDQYQRMIQDAYVQVTQGQLATHSMTTISLAMGGQGLGFCHRPSAAAVVTKNKRHSSSSHDLPAVPSKIALLRR